MNLRTKQATRTRTHVLHHVCARRIALLINNQQICRYSINKTYNIYNVSLYYLNQKKNNTLSVKQKTLVHKVIKYNMLYQVTYVLY